MTAVSSRNNGILSPKYIVLSRDKCHPEESLGRVSPLTSFGRHDIIVTICAPNIALPTFHALQYLNVLLNPQNFAYQYVKVSPLTSLGRHDNIARPHPPIIPGRNRGNLGTSTNIALLTYCSSQYLNVLLNPKNFAYQYVRNLTP